MKKELISAIIATLGTLDIKPTRHNTNKLEAVYQALEKEMEKEENNADQNGQRADV